MSHFAEHPPIRRGDSFDGLNRIVGIKTNIGCRIALQIYILSGDLPILGHFCTSASSATNRPPMGNGYCMNIPYATVHHPWGLVGGYPSAHQHRLMASNGVEGQRRAAAVGIDNLAKRNQPQLNQRLEAIADAAHQTVAVLKQLVYPLFNLWIAEKSSDKFAGTFRLIAARRTLLEWQ